MYFDTITDVLYVHVNADKKKNDKLVAKLQHLFKTNCLLKYFNRYFKKLKNIT